MFAHESSASHKNTQIPNLFCLYAVMPNNCWVSVSVILTTLWKYTFPQSMEQFSYLLTLYFLCTREILCIFLLFLCECLAPSELPADTSTNSPACPTTHLQWSPRASGPSWCHMEERQSVLTVICTLVVRINNYYSCKPVSLEVIRSVEVGNWLIFPRL